MGYVPYTGNKDYFEEPLTGGDLVIRYNLTNAAITCISETDIGALGLVAPSARIGIAAGKGMDIIKVFVKSSTLNSDTTTLLLGTTGVYSTLSGTFYPTLKRQYDKLGIPYASIITGKVLRVDYIPDSTASTPSAVVTLAIYI